MATVRKSTTSASGSTSSSKGAGRTPSKAAVVQGVAAASTPSQQPALGTAAGGPIFAEPTPAPASKKYATAHASDSQAYAELDKLIAGSKFLPLPFPVVNRVAEPVLTLAAALGKNGPAAVAKIAKAGQIVFQAAGDTGATRGPASETTTVLKMLSDFTGEAANAAPQFFYNLGDVVYSFGEHKYYFDQFYDAYRNYPAPIFAIAGNHDGIVLPPPAGTGDAKDSLSAFLANFCAPQFAHPADALGLSRTTMIQPGVYFTLDAPMVRILGLYSNVLENPGVISSFRDPKSGVAKFANLSDAQLTYLATALTRVKTDNFKGAVLIAVHHPPYCYGKHTGSLVMLKEIDAICAQTGVWPHAVLSGHAHNYQRFTRSVTPAGKGARQIPYLVVGNGGHGLTKLSNAQDALRTPQAMPVFSQPERKDTITFESYDDDSYGYVRVLVNAQQLRIEYHPASDGTGVKTPDDSVTVDLATGTLAHYNPPA